MAAAQNQHYVPKFILRKFLSDNKNERVAVYDKHTDKTFITSIKNIMAERRFNEFTFDDDWIASFEPVACGAEDQVLPVYLEVVERRRLDDTPEQKAALAVLVAFQFLRTKANRDAWQAIEEEMVKKVEASGGRMQDVRGCENWQPSTEDSLKREHLLSIQGSIGEYARIIAAKDFVLAEPAAGRSFYLGDNPICLANSRDFGLRSNLGLSVAGIEIYMPLAADLMLCAWCPSILGELKEGHEHRKKDRRTEAVGRVMAGELSPTEMKRIMERLQELERPNEELIATVSEGRPVSSSDQNMDYYNSLQTAYAYRYIVCQQADFALARRFNRKTRPSDGDADRRQLSSRWPRREARYLNITGPCNIMWSSIISRPSDMVTIKTQVDDNTYRQLVADRKAAGLPSVSALLLKNSNALDEAGEAREIVRKAKYRAGRLRPDDKFRLKDLFKPNQWEGFSKGARLRAGRLFYEMVSAAKDGILPGPKSGSGHQTYLRR
jgi:hypothetical protein